MDSKKFSLEEWLKALALVAVLFFLYRFFQNAGWVNAINVRNQNATLGVALLVGFVASLSSCLAVVGSIVIAFGERYDARSKSFFSGVVRPNLFFHIGRVATFFVLGGALGAIGGSINLSGSFVSIYTIIIAVVMAWLGLSILGIVPSISALGLRPPKFVTRLWARTEESEHKAAPFLLGAITFFLPCGFTQSMQILALASGSFSRGALLLSVFSLGTLPILFALGVSASWGRAKNLNFIQKAAGILVLAFAVFTLQSGLALRGVKTSVVSSAAEKNTQNSNQDTTENFQTVEMHVTNQGFEPNVLTLKAGTPVRWRILGDQVSGCTSTIIISSFNISKSIRSGENIVQFMPRDKGTINFSCGMGMVRGKFVVEP